MMIFIKHHIILTNLNHKIFMNLNHNMDDNDI